MNIALAVMARAPSSCGKTRLRATLQGSGFDPSADGLSRCLLRDTLEVVARVPSQVKREHSRTRHPGTGHAGTGRSGTVHVYPVILYTPAGAEQEFLELAPFRPRLLLQRGRDLGERMHSGFIDLLPAEVRLEPDTTEPRDAVDAAMIIGSDLPSLPPENLLAAVDALRGGGDRVVLGPAADGGYYLIGLTRPRPELFAGLAWGGNSVCADTLQIAARLGLEVRMIPEWYDVDDDEGLARLMRERAGTAGHTRAWLGAHPI